MKSDLFSMASSILNKVARGAEVETQGFRGSRIDGAANVLNELAEKYKAFEVIAKARHESNKHNVGEIIIISDFAIVEVLERDENPKYFHIVGGRASSTYSEDVEIAILNAMAEKYEGLNSDFANYACKMLGKVIR